MQRALRSATVAIALAMALAACGSGDNGSEDTGATMEDASASSTTAAEGDRSGADATVPDDLPVPVPDGGEVTAVAEPSAGSLQDRTVVTLQFPEDEFDVLVEHFDRWFSEEGIEVEAVPGTGRHRWTWTVTVAGTPQVQEVLLTTGGTHDRGGTTLRVSYDGDS